MTIHINLANSNHLKILEGKLPSLNDPLYQPKRHALISTLYEQHLTHQHPPFMLIAPDGRAYQITIEY
jgi:hypothetical protein